MIRGLYGLILSILIAMAYVHYHGQLHIPVPSLHFHYTHDNLTVYW